MTQSEDREILNLADVADVSNFFYMNENVRLIFRNLQQELFLFYFYFISKRIETEALNFDLIC